jgi:putative membrane protein
MAENPDQLELAIERTFIAYERTLLAWIRTSASLITFGFTLYKFFEYLNEDDPDRIRNRIVTARGFGVAMILAGIATLILAAVQYRQGVRRLRTQDVEMPFPVAPLVAALIAVLGLLALIETVFRHL